MLGSWSLGDYWKRDACSLALKLLTEEFKIERDKLVVTYFGGSNDLEPDLETLDIWRSLGFPENRIHKLGLEDNFWEMGMTGECIIRK